MIDRAVLRARIAASGLTLEQLAERIGSHQSSLSRFFAEPPKQESLAARIVAELDRIEKTASLDSTPPASARTPHTA